MTENGDETTDKTIEAIKTEEGAKETAIETLESKVQDKPVEEEEKPKAKKFKPPGGVPMMGFGGALMAEMKKKRGIKVT